MNTLQTQDFDTTQGICSKAYVNVFATSHDEPDAWVCCDGFDTSSANGFDNVNNGYTYFSYKTLLCHPWVSTVSSESSIILVEGIIFFFMSHP